MGMLLNRARDDVIYGVLDIKWFATENILLRLIMKDDSFFF